MFVLVPSIHLFVGSKPLHSEDTRSSLSCCLFRPGLRRFAVAVHLQADLNRFFASTPLLRLLTLTLDLGVKAPWPRFPYVLFDEFGEVLLEACS
jgi:hypothetical protein